VFDRVGVFDRVNVCDGVNVLVAVGGTHVTVKSIGRVVPNTYSAGKFRTRQMRSMIWPYSPLLVTVFGGGIGPAIVPVRN
jgi:hypothetical protein